MFPINLNDKKDWSLEGWHTLVLQVNDGVVKYFVDGKLLGEHHGRAYSVVPMSINFNQWFTAEGLTQSGELRQYQQEVDWVLHLMDEVRSPEEVERAVSQLRSQNVSFVDTVPEHSPPLPSPCNF